MFDGQQLERTPQKCTLARVSRPKVGRLSSGDGQERVRDFFFIFAGLVRWDQAMFITMSYLLAATRPAGANGIRTGAFSKHR
jgi:hypothetical protein